MSKKQDFEAAYKRLEEIARLLESNDVKLQQSIELYEEGMKLIQACSAQLDEAEQKLLLLSKSESGFETKTLDEPSGD